MYINDNTDCGRKNYMWEELNDSGVRETSNKTSSFYRTIST